MAITLEDLDRTFKELTRLVCEIRNYIYPCGKPDWMSQEHWDEISGKNTEVKEER